MFLKRLLVILLLTQTFVYAQQNKYKTENVIVLIMDGPRYSETWGDSTHQYIPHFANDMAPHGVIFTDFRNEGPTYTCAGHTAICTGVYQSIKNNGKQWPKKASIFQHWLKTTGKPRNAAWVISSKDKLTVLTDCKDKKWKGQYRPMQDIGNNGLYSGYRDDHTTYVKTIEILDKYKPQLVLVNFKNPDVWGHGNNWENYLSSMKKSDEYIYLIFQHILRSEHYKDKTTIFVTNDHGRHLDGHKDGFVSHGDNCEGCRKINFFAFGPDFKENVIMESGRDLIDIPVTIGELMGFTLPDSKGEVMTELFK